MARYTGPKTKISRAFGQKLFGADKGFDKLKNANKLNPPGQHGATKRRKQRSDYALQLMEKQKAKYIYGLLERQFFKTFQAAVRRSGVTGEVLLQLLEARLDNTVFRLGIAPTRNAARQLVSHNHITVNGRVVNIPSFSLRPGDVVAVRGRSQNFEVIETALSRKTEKNAWLEWNRDKMEGVFLAFPTRDQITETINEQLIVELYSK